MCRGMSCARVVIFGLFSFLGFLLYFGVSFSFLHLFRLDKNSLFALLSSSNDDAFPTYIPRMGWGVLQTKSTYT